MSKRTPPRLRVLRAVQSSRIKTPKAPCPVCLGSRVIKLSTWPLVRFGRCPNCNGVDPNPASDRREAA